MWRLAELLAPRAQSLSKRPVKLANFSRQLRTINFGGTNESVFERADYPLSFQKQIFAPDLFGVLGYGTQGRAQALNLRDNGFPVVVGLRFGGESWNKAVKDGWIPNETLLPYEEAARKSSVVMYLLSDAGQKLAWPKVKPCLTPGKTLYFSHGFSIVFSEQTGVVPPKDVDVIMVAPKGSGATVRSLFLEGRGINSSVAVWQNYSGNASKRAQAMGFAVGSGYLYKTTFEKEVYSDLTGERGALMGGIYGLFKAQYDVLRARGHSPSEAFNETVEEATQSLIPLIGANGMDWMFANCSTTARRGALDWFPAFYSANKPVIERIYDSVSSGKETQRTLDFNSSPDHREKLEASLEEIKSDEMWQAGVAVRKLRPEFSEDCAHSEEQSPQSQSG